MLKVIGNIERVKQEMRVKPKAVKAEIRRLKESIRNAEKRRKEALSKGNTSLAELNSEVKVSLKNQVEELEGKLLYYKLSRVIPVVLENGIVINHLMYKRFTDRLKSPYTLELTKEHLKVRHSNGFASFHDLSDKYEDFEYIPEAELTRAVIKHGETP